MLATQELRQPLMSNIHKRVRFVKTPLRTIGKRFRFVKEALRFVPLERMVSSLVDRYTICKLHLINTCKQRENEWSIGTIGTIGTNGKVVNRLVNHWNLHLKTNVMT